VNLFRIAKQLKKRLRRIRRPVWVLGALFTFILVFLISRSVTGGSLQVFGHDPLARIKTSQLTDEQASLAEQLVKDGKSKQVVLVKQYICGQESESLGMMPAAEIVRLWTEHPDWDGERTDEDTIRFVEQIDDLSESCKGNAYMSVDKDGNLSLFEGPPEQKKVIRTFFQIDVDFLESSLPHDTVASLYRGIRIHDISEYNSVISTFSEYAVDVTEKVMKPAD
jgi:forespore regulator of the sigma-K checkpoint